MKTKGIRFYPQSIEVDDSGSAPIFIHGTIEDDRSNFDYIFSSLYDHWKDLRFIDEEGFSIFRADLTENEEDQLYDRFDSSRINEFKESEYHTPLIYRKAEVFKEFGRYAGEFEGGGFCLVDSSTSLKRALEIEEEIWRGDAIHELPKEIHCLLHNWDGVFWQIFSRSGNELEILRAKHAGRKGMLCYWVDLQEDFPSPRGSSPDEAKMKQVEPVAPRLPLLYPLDVVEECKHASQLKML